MLPMILAHSLFHFGYGSYHHNSKGTLLTPPILLPEDKSNTWKIALLQKPENNTMTQNVITKRWQALGKDQSRVQLLLLLPGSPQKNTDPQKDLNPSQWVEQTIPNHLWTQLTTQQSKQHKPCKQFILDPENQAILCYDHDNLPRDIDLDLRKLLKWSR